MASYSVFIKASAQRESEALPAKDRVRVLDRIGRLAEDPRPPGPRPPGCEKLSTLERYRLRQGDYRIVYSVEDRVLTVWVVKVGHRRDVYRRP